MLNAHFLKNFLFSAVSLGGIQGTVYLLQLLSAGQMSEREFGAVRIIESAAAIGALFVTFGVPSAVLVKLASSKAQTRLFLLSILFMVTAGALVAIPYFTLSASDNKISIAILAALVSLRLLLTATTQARHNFATLAIASVISSILAFIDYFFYDAAGIDRWLYARYSLELVTIAILLFNEIKILLRSQSQPEAILRPLVAMSIPLGASLAIRSIVEHGPVLWLAFIRAQDSLIALVGIIITLGTIALLPGAVVQSVIVPQLAQSKTRPELISAIGKFAISVILTGLTFAVLASIADHFLAWSHLNLSLLLGGSLMVMAKMSAGASGGILLAHHKSLTIFILNTITLTIALAVASGISAGQFGAETIIWTIAGIELFGATMYVTAILLLFRSARLVSS